MSTQNENGCGCFWIGVVWLWNQIISITNNRKISKYNKQSRGLQEYPSMTTDIVFPVESYRENIIISGGDGGDRLRFSERILKNSVAQGRSMIVLHVGNGSLENVIARNSFGTIVNKRSKTFDAFTSFELQEICQVVLDTCKSRYDIKPAGRYILEIVYELLKHKGLRPYFFNFANASYHQLDEKINAARSSGLSPAIADKLDRLLMMGQAEIAKIDQFFYDMKANMSHIATDGIGSATWTSVLSAIKRGQLLCIDLNASSNPWLVELIVNTLTIAMNRGYEFSLFVDDVAIANNEPLKNVLCHKSNYNNIICSKDLYALLTGKDDVFTTIAGEAEKTILLSHGSHLSCEKWSKYIGEYDKIDVSNNSNAGWGISRHLGYNTNRGQTEKLQREYKIKPEQINRLPPGQIFIYDNQTHSLIQTNVI